MLSLPGSPVCLHITSRPSWGAYVASCAPPQLQCSGIAVPNMLRKVARAYFAVRACFKPGELPPICIGTSASHCVAHTGGYSRLWSADDLAVSGPLKQAYRRFRRRGKPDAQGKVDAAGVARALRVKETPFLRKLLVCWDRDGVRCCVSGL